jgi:hypothetical protein
VEFVRLSRLYASRPAPRTAPLAAYPTLGRLLDAFFGPDQADPDTRRELLCAVLAELPPPDPLGAAVTLHCFRGMLVRLSKSLCGVDDRDEADALVVAGLLEALPRIRPERDPDRIGMYVRQETRRAVFAALRRDTRARKYQEALDADELYARHATATGEAGDGDEVGGGDHEWGTSAEDDDAWREEPTRDPLARERASQQRTPDAIVDPESLAPIEDRMLLERPAVDGIPDATLLQADAVRGGLRRLTSFLFADADPREQERCYREIARRARRARDREVGRATRHRK